jgi:hypothetical protein
MELALEGTTVVTGVPGTSLPLAPQFLEERVFRGQPDAGRRLASRVGAAWKIEAGETPTGVPLRSRVIPAGEWGPDL